MKEYSFSYRFDNKDWTVSIYANNEEEAKRKFWALKENGKYDGEIIYKMNVAKSYNLLESFLSKIKNIWNSN